MDILSYNKARETKDKIILGESKDLIGTPSDGSYVLAGSIVLRESYPELDALYPQTPAAQFTVLDRNIPLPLKGDLVAYGNNTWVIVEYNSDATIYSVDDGVTWNVGTGLPLGRTWKSIIFANGVFVIIGLNGFAYSSDGQTWNATAPVFEAYDVAYGNGRFVAIGYNAGLPVCAYSISGSDWTQSSSGLVSGFGSNITFGNNKFITIADFTGDVYWSDNGETWVNTTNSIGNGVWAGNLIDFDGTKFIAVSYQSNSTLYATSISGDSWVLSSLPSAGIYNSWVSIAIGNGIILLNTGDKYALSINGEDWELHSKSPSYDGYGLGYGNGIFIEGTWIPQIKAIEAVPVNPYIDLTGVEGQYVRVK